MTGTGLTAQFEADTAVEPLGDGLFATRLNGQWSAPRGPNGGYLAATVLRALQASEPDTDRAPRSLTLHYLRPPADGEATIAVSVERRGRSLTTLTARLEQNGKLCVLALGALALDFPAPVEYAEPMPEVRPFAQTPLLPRRDDRVPPIAHRFEIRPVLGGRPFGGGEHAETGGWISFSESDPSPLDAPALAMLSDAWLPAPFFRMREPVPAPTIDLTIHFRTRSEGRTGPAFVLFRSGTSREGYFEEDGELWSSDGILLAQSRQLALLTP